MGIHSCKIMCTEREINLEKIPQNMCTGVCVYMCVYMHVCKYPHAK